MEQEENKNLMAKMEEDVPSPGTASMMDQDPSAMIQEENTPRKKEPNYGSLTTSPPVKINYSQGNIDEMEEIIESVVDEKWRSLVENFGDIGLWKDKVRTEVLSIKQELVRMDSRFENLQKAVLGKVKDYDKNMIDVSSNIKALEKVFEKILDPLTTNIKELNKITKDLKKK